MQRFNDITHERANEWDSIRSYLKQRYVEDDLIYCFTALNEIVAYLGNEEEYPDIVKDIVLPTLQSEIIHIYRIVDESGLSKFIGTRDVYDALREFSFADTSFREEEMSRLQEAHQLARQRTQRQIKELNVPEEAWNKLMDIVNNEKERILRRIDYCVTNREPFSFEPFYASSVNGLKDKAFEFTHLSPKKWRKGILAGLAGLLGVANLVTIIPSGGITTVSAVQMLGAIVGAIGAAVD